MNEEHILKKLREQDFLLQKLSYCLDNIAAHEGSFLDQLNHLHLEAAIAKFREHVHAMPDMSAKASFNIDPNALLLHTPFVYYLDSFVIDVKRALLFSVLALYVAWRGHDNDAADFKFHGTFLNQIRPDHDQQKKQFIDFLLGEEKASEFILFARENYALLGKLNGRRTLIEHGSLSYGIDKLILELTWGKDQEPNEYPEIVDFGHLMMRGKPLIEALREEIEFLNVFRVLVFHTLEALGHVQR